MLLFAAERKLFSVELFCKLCTEMPADLTRDPWACCRREARKFSIEPGLLGRDIQNALCCVSGGGGVLLRFAPLRGVTLALVLVPRSRGEYRSSIYEPRCMFLAATMFTLR